MSEIFNIRQRYWDEAKALYEECNSLATETRYWRHTSDEEDSDACRLLRKFATAVYYSVSEQHPFRHIYSDGKTEEYGPVVAMMYDHSAARWRSLTHPLYEYEGFYDRWEHGDTSDPAIAGMILDIWELMQESLLHNPTVLKSQNKEQPITDDRRPEDVR